MKTTYYQAQREYIPKSWFDLNRAYECRTESEARVFLNKSRAQLPDMPHRIVEVIETCNVIQP